MKTQLEIDYKLHVINTLGKYYGFIVVTSKEYLVKLQQQSISCINWSLRNLWKIINDVYGLDNL